MITQLEQIAARAVRLDHSQTPNDGSESDPDDLELTRRAARALEQLRQGRGADRIAGEVREALGRAREVAANDHPPDTIMYAGTAAEPKPGEHDYRRTTATSPTGLNALGGKAYGRDISPAGPSWRD
jgi:hypothetical protein